MLFSPVLRRFCFAGLLVWCAAAGASAPKTLHVGIGLKRDTPQGQAVDFFARQLNASSGGRIKVVLHDAGELGDDLKMVSALQAGTQEMTCPDSATLTELVRALSAINYPFTFLDEKEADRVLDGEWGSSLLAQLPKHGVVGLAFWENGFRHFTNSKRPVRTAADFQGLKMRTMQNPMLVDSFRLLGFQPVPMPFPRVYAALQSGDVDGQENPLPTILSSRFYEVQKFLTLSRHVYSVFVLLISKKTWDALPSEDQRLVREAAVQARDYQRRMNRQRNREALDALKVLGMQVTSIPWDEAERTRVHLRPVLDRYNDSIGSTEVLKLYIELGRIRTHGRGTADMTAGSK